MVTALRVAVAVTRALAALQRDAARARTVLAARPRGRTGTSRSCGSSPSISHAAGASRA